MLATTYCKRHGCSKFVEMILDPMTLQEEIKNMSWFCSDDCLHVYIKREVELSRQGMH